MTKVRNHDYNDLPLEYHQIYMRNTQQDPTKTAQQAQDDSLTEYEGVLYSEIRIIGNNVKIIELSYSWFIFKIRMLIDFVCSLFTLQSKKLSQTETLSGFAFYAEKYDAQRKSKGKTLKMKEFCAQENINFDEFNLYYCKYCQKK